MCNWIGSSRSFKHVSSNDRGKNYWNTGKKTEKNSAYVGLNTTTLSRRPTMHLNESSSITFHLKNYSIPNSTFRKFLVENTSLIAHEIDKLWQQILGALQYKNKNPKINKINFENSDNVLKCF